MIYDAIIAGGGPAGLSAALILGRCRRRVLVCDAGRPRNAASGGVHGFLTRDGMLPSELARISREQIQAYGVEIREAIVSTIAREDNGFVVCLDKGVELRCRKLLLATGVRDKLPDIEGLAGMWGKSVHHCPYCDGWEWRDQPLAVYAPGNRGFGLAMSLRTTWSEDVALLTSGPSLLSRTQRAELARWNIPVYTGKIARLEGQDGVLQRVLFRNGETLARRALFVNTGFEQQCELARSIGCNFTHKGVVDTGHKEETNIPGLFVAGDSSRDVQMVIVAAAEGVKAATAINEQLQKEDRAAAAR